MNTRFKTRSDYHVFSPNPAGLPLLGLQRCVKPLFWMTIGAVLGMSYNKKSIDSCYDLLAFTEAEKRTVVATSEIQTQPLKGKASSSV